VIGYDVQGKKIIGYGKLYDDVTSIIKWDDYLINKKLVFDFWNDVPIKFYEEPNGDQIYFSLEPSEYTEYDYIMRPIKKNDNWMYVEVTSPSDNCNEPKYKIVKKFWIKYLKDNNVPIVFYFPRGC
jgi:hypothetical protein